MGLERGGCSFGADPELFLANSVGVIGSEKVIPKEGLKVTGGGGGSFGFTRDGAEPAGQKIVLDGVQVELHLNASHCRAHLGNELRAHFSTLKRHLAAMKGTNVSFDAVVRVPQAELDSLSEESKRLGCAPSKNVYDQNARIDVSAAKSLTRSAGGHLHFGLQDTTYGQAIIYSPPQVDHRARLVPLFDALIGNTCVMIDRDPLAAERRKVYGRAGEYRLPKYGIEYRTLSNFWLRAFPLFALVMALGRLSISVLTTTLIWGAKNDPEADLLRLVDIDKVRQAINENDLTLARENWQGVKEFVKKYEPSGYNQGLSADTLDVMDFFFKRIEEKGLEYWFPDDPMKHWCTLPEGHAAGWETFRDGRVRHELLASMSPALTVKKPRASRAKVEVVNG